MFRVDPLKYVFTDLVDPGGLVLILDPDRPIKGEVFLDFKKKTRFFFRSKICHCYNIDPQNFFALGREGKTPAIVTFQSFHSFTMRETNVN